MLIGLCGYKGVGKSTIANILVENYGFVKFAFADSVKDVLSYVFGWDRELLEGDTEESRIFRETKDEWWTSNLGFEVSPRNMMTRIATEMFRDTLHKDIWILSLENKIRNILEDNEKIVICDYRFSDNEYYMIKNYNGIIVRVDDGNIPEYENNIIYKKNVYKGKGKNSCLNTAKVFMDIIYPNVHSSEYSFLCKPFDYIIDNKIKNRETLERNVFMLMKNIYEVKNND